MSGADALDTLRTSGPVEVLLSDLRMARMNGVQLAVEVLRRLPAVRVVLMAAYPSVDPLDWPVVVKPFPLEVLEAEVPASARRTGRPPQLREVSGSGHLRGTDLPPRRPLPDPLCVKYMFPPKLSHPRIPLASVVSPDQTAGFTPKTVAGFSRCAKFTTPTCPDWRREMAVCGTA